jgi:hypothetical protein
MTTDLFNSIAEQVMDSSGLAEKELHRHQKALCAHLENPMTTVFDKMLVQCWGKRAQFG